MKIKKTSYFFISGGILFTLLIINQLYSYYYLNMVTPQFSADASSELQQMQKELAAEGDMVDTSSRVGVTTSLADEVGLSSFTANSSSINATKKIPEISDSAKAIKQAEGEIAKLNQQLRESEGDYRIMKDSLAKCTSIEHMGDRLDCFDKLTHQQKQTGKKNGSRNKSWVIRKNISPIDDSASLSLTANARETFKTYGGDSVRPVFSVACDPERTVVMLSTGHYMTKGNYFFETRIGKNKSSALSWRMDEKGKAAYLEMQTRDFIKKLIVSDQLAIQIGSTKEPNSVLTFDLTGLADENEELKKFCGVST